MYLGLLLMLLGWAAYLAHPLACAVPPVFVLYMNRFQILPEERALQAKFGPAFEADNDARHCDDGRDHGSHRQGHRHGKPHRGEHRRGERAYERGFDAGFTRGRESAAS